MKMIAIVSTLLSGILLLCACSGGNQYPRATTISVVNSPTTTSLLILDKRGETYERDLNQVMSTIKQ